MTFQKTIENLKLSRKTEVIRKHFKDHHALPEELLINGHNILCIREVGSTYLLRSNSKSFRKLERINDDSIISLFGYNSELYKFFPGSSPKLAQE